MHNSRPPTEHRLSGFSENAASNATRESHLWILAILVMLSLTLVVNALDFVLWLERGTRHGTIASHWHHALLRVVLLTAVSAAGVYFYRVAKRLVGINKSLVNNLDAHAKLLSEKNSQLARLKQLSEALISQVDLKPAFDLSLEMVVDVIGARTASIMLLDKNREELTIAAARGLSEEIVRTARVKVGQGLAGVVALEGEAIVINSDELDERLAAHATRTKEIKSAIIAPIKMDGVVCGVINVSDKRGGDRWTDEDLSMVSTLAGQAAMVLQKIGLYDNLQKQVAMLEETLTQLKKTQAELIQSEKLASIGQLAGGVAHEINNPLLVILGRAELALDKVTEDHPAKKDLDVIHTQTERIAEIVRNLLNFSRTSKIGDSREVDVNQIIERTLSLTEAQMIKARISVTRELSDDLPMLQGNPGQLQQVFVNIAINAYQAMAKIGGAFTVSTKNLGDHVLIKFSDTGPGISPEDIETIFEPFYTTKDEMEGTGLGLAISRGIIHAHGGKIEAGGEHGNGAVFTVELPTTEAQSQMEKKYA